MDRHVRLKICRFIHLPLLKIDSWPLVREGGDGPFDVLPMIGTVIALFAIGVMMALACGSNVHAGDKFVTRDDKGGSAGEDAAHFENLDEETQDELVSAEDEDCCNEVCANCGNLGSDLVKLKKCNACRLVKYCGVDCQKAHRKQHKKACKKRAAELKDEQLYSQGHKRPEGDFCPICTLPIPLPMNKHSMIKVCCMKRISNGCALAAHKSCMFDCPFCRAPRHEGNRADALAMVQARVAKKDPAAIYQLGQMHYHGIGLQKDVRKAFEVWKEAAELGSIAALCSIGVAYEHGEGVEQDEAKGIHFYGKAAMQGHVESRYQLGWIEGRKGNFDRAVRHFLISAKMGHEDSLEAIKNVFMEGLATKEQYAHALRGYQDAVEEMKSHGRDQVKKAEALKEGDRKPGALGFGWIQ